MNQLQLDKIALVNFKNCREASINLHPTTNCIIGANGQGKTNLLDAIHYLSFCKSYFNPIDTQHIHFDEPFFLVQGYFSRMGEQEDLYCGLKRASRKQFKRNKKEYSRLAEHVGLFPVVMITPYDAALILDGSEVRRRFVDMVISQTDKQYLDALIRYNKILQQRNTCLKQAHAVNTDLLEAFDVQLIPLNRRIHETRAAFMKEFLPFFSESYKQIAQGAEEVGLNYTSQLHETNAENLYKKSRQKDLAARHSTAGIHKDDLEFLMNGHPLKKFGSQGQQKTFLLALKFAQYHYTAAKTGLLPILLLDDIFDKLDSTRVSSMLQLVNSERFGQVFLTDTDASKAPEILNALQVEHKIFDITQGNIIERT